jgi:hypothetical protein
MLLPTAQLVFVVRGSLCCTLGTSTSISSTSAL